MRAPLASVWGSYKWDDLQKAEACSPKKEGCVWGGVERLLLPGSRVSAQERGGQGMMGVSHRTWYPPFSRQQRFMRVCRQSEQQEALEEVVLEDSREEIIDGTKPPASRQEVECRHCPV